MYRRIFLFAFIVLLLCLTKHIDGRPKKKKQKQSKKNNDNNVNNKKKNEKKKKVKKPLYDQTKVKSTSEKALLDIIEIADEFDSENKDEMKKKIQELKKAYVFFKKWKHQVGPDTAYALGRRLLEHEDNVEAEDAFQHALKHLPDSPDAKLSLAISQLQQGTFISAQKAYLSLGNVKQRDFGTNDRLSISQYIFAEALRQSFRYEDSIQVYENFLSLRSNITKDKDVIQDTITNYFSACLESDTKPKLDLVRIACNKIKTFRCYEHLGGWYMHLNKIKKAKKYFNKALKFAGPKFTAFYNLKEHDAIFPVPPTTGVVDEDANMIVPEKVIVKRDFISLEEADGLADILDESVESYLKLPRRICYKSGSAPTDLYPYLYKDKTKVGYDCLNETVKLHDDAFISNYKNAEEGGDSKFSKHIINHMPSYSTSIFIDNKDVPLVQNIEHRIFKTFGLNNRDGWPMQLLKYPTDVGYAPHTDCTLERLDPLDRSFTVLIYLNHVRSGGSTRFPKLSKEIIAERGTAVIFPSIDADGHCTPLMIHEGMKVLGNKPKYILQKWYRRSGHRRRISNSNYFSFHSEVKDKKEPRILCDLSKSCREYIPVDYSLINHMTKEEL